MKIRCKYDALVPVKDLKPNPKNPNKHTPEQIIKVAGLLEFYGWNKSIVVSNQSGFINTGHCRLLSAKHNGWEKVPVEYQDFESPEIEYGCMVSDNTADDESFLDLAMINVEIPELGPDLPIEMLGINGFGIDPEFKPGTEEEQGKLDRTQILECPHCGKPFEKAQAKIIA